MIPIAVIEELDSLKKAEGEKALSGKIEEAQNMTPKQVTGIITRAGKGTKVILLGDPNQIDTPFLDERTNGLSYASERMKGSKWCYQITLTTNECERSELALDAIKRM